MADRAIHLGGSGAAFVRPMSSSTHKPAALLSKTFNPSSIIRWILPARIRSPSKNDIVFVGETFVQLREFLPTGLLADPTAKQDFGVQIIAAQVVSAKLEITSVLDAILNQERDQEQYTIDGKPVDESQPPQILVLSTAGNELIFVCAKDDASGVSSFIFSKRSLLRGVSLPPRQCSLMAVDHDSRALAVASSDGYISVFKLRSVAQIKSQMDKWIPTIPQLFGPWDEQRFIQIDGSILKMEFLRSNVEGEIVLVLLVGSNDDTHSLLYRANINTPLRKMALVEGSGWSLKEDRFPLMLIPSTRPYCFVLVLENGISYYENVNRMHGRKRIHCSLRQQTTGTLLWVHWAKPRRHNDYLEKRDDLVIVREDGLLRYFQIEKASSIKFNMNNVVGNLGIRVDEAFCMLAGPPDMGGDVIIAGGDMTEGGVFHVLARGVPEKQQNIFNLAPVSDMIIVPKVPKADLADATRLEATNRVLVCGGGKASAKGYVAEVLYGLEARIGWIISSPEMGDVQTIWALELVQQKSLLIVTSHMNSTKVMALELETQGIDAAFADRLHGFDLDNSTLITANIGGDKILQVTTNGVNIITRVSPDTYEPCIQKEADFLIADVFEQGDTIAIARKLRAGFEVGLLSITTEQGSPVGIKTAPSSAVLAEEPVSLCCASLKNGRVLFVGTSTAKWLAFYVMPDNTLELVFSQLLTMDYPEIRQSPITSLTSLSHVGTSNLLLLCGLRSGVVMCYEVKISEEHVLSVRYDDVHHLGSTTVRISKETAPSSNPDLPAALLLCDSQTHRVTLHPNNVTVDYSISSVHLTSSHTPAGHRAEVNAISRIPVLTSMDGEPGGLILCATDEELLFASLVGQEQTILTRLNFKGTPRCLLYSEYLKQFVVVVEHRRRIPKIQNGAYGETEVTEQDPKLDSGTEQVKARPYDETVQIMFEFLDQDLKTSSICPRNCVLEDNNVRLTALIEWDVGQGAPDEEIPRWFVFAVEDRDHNTSRSTGRVMATSAKNFLKGASVPAPRVLYRSVKGPVRALCPHKQSWLLIAAGSEILLYNLSIASRKWTSSSKFDLPSPATAISSRDSYIFVSTSHHSMVVLREFNGRLIEGVKDTVARNLNNVVEFGKSYALFSVVDSSGSQILGLSLFDEANTFRMFEAKFPLHVERIRPLRSSDAKDSERYHFYASTTDGTIYHYCTLTHEEWVLLEFIQSLGQFGREKVKPVPLRRKDYSNGNDVVIHPSRTTSQHMHIRGDRLFMVTQPGPYNLHRIVRTTAQFDTLEALAEPVIGQTEHPIEVVMIWLRKLLSFPTR